MSDEPREMTEENKKALKEYIEKRDGIKLRIDSLFKELNFLSGEVDILQDRRIKLLNRSEELFEEYKKLLVEYLPRLVYPEYREEMEKYKEEIEKVFGDLKKEAESGDFETLLETKDLDECEKCGFPCFETNSCLRCGHPVKRRAGANGGGGEPS